MLAAHGLLGVTQCYLRRCDEILPPVGCKTHSPCSQLHARLAGAIADSAGGLLPHRFTPYRSTGALSGADTEAGILSVAVVVKQQLPVVCPHLLFREATLPANP